MVLVDDFVIVQNVMESSFEYVQVLVKCGIIDIKKVVVMLLIVGYFGGKDVLQEDVWLFKVVSYFDVGDGNYWGYFIENLVVVVDLVQKKVIKIEDNGVILVLMKLIGYDGSGCVLVLLFKLLDISEFEGKNYIIIGNILCWCNWEMYFKLDLCVGLMFLIVIYNDYGKKCQIMYEGLLGGMIVFYGDLDVGWYFKVYLDLGEYGMGMLILFIECGKDVFDNVVLLDVILVDISGKLCIIFCVIGVFECYVGLEFKYQEYG